MTNWVDKAYKQNADERYKSAERVLDRFAEYSPKAADLASAIADLKEFEKPSFLTHIHFIPFGKSKVGKVRDAKFPALVGAYKHKTLPVIIAIAADRKTLSLSGRDEEILDNENKGEVKQLLSWGSIVSAMNGREKRELEDLLLGGLRAQRGSKRRGDVWLSDFIAEGGEYELVGFAANIPYINLDEAYGDTGPIWVHPLGIPALLLKHRELPSLMIASPSIRLNENLAGATNMEGYTG